MHSLHWQFHPTLFGLGFPLKCFSDSFHFIGKKVIQIKLNWMKNSNSLQLTNILTAFALCHRTKAWLTLCHSHCDECCMAKRKVLHNLFFLFYRTCRKGAQWSTNQALQNLSRVVKSSRASGWKLLLQKKKHFLLLWPSSAYPLFI